MRQAEPIRTAELLRAARVREKLLARRTIAPSGAGGTSDTVAGPLATNDAEPVPVRIAAVIDAWLAALDQFAVDALKPDSRELIDRLKRLRDATRVAKDAIGE